MNAPEHYSPVMPYLVVSDAEKFIDFIHSVFDADEKLAVRHDDGSIIHAEFTINGGTIMFGQAGGEWKPFPCGIFVITDAVDNTYERALASGARSIQEPGERGYGRAAGVEDGFGNQWWLNTPDCSGDETA